MAVKTFSHQGTDLEVIRFNAVSCCFCYAVVMPFLKVATCSGMLMDNN